MAFHQPRNRPGRPRGARPGAAAAGRGAAGKPLSVAGRHAEWVGLLRPDGPFIAVPVLTDAFPQGLDTVPDDTLDKLRLAWAEVQAAPDLLNPAWCQLVLSDLLGYTPATLAEGGALPADLRSGPSSKLRPDAVAYGPDGQDGRAERLLIYRLPWDTPLTRAGRDLPSAAEQAAELCRHRGTPLALLTNGGLWALVHARPDESTTTAVFDADLWLEERDLLRGFASLLHARRVLPPPRQPNGEHSASLAALFARSAEAQAEVTSTLGIQVRQAVELLVGELSRLDRESASAVLGQVKPREVYRAALTVMMRLVFLLYAEEQRLLPVTSDLYASAYSVTSLHDQLDAEQNLYGDEVGDRRAAAWPRLLATFAAVYGGCEHDEMRIPPYGGDLFDPGRYPWLELLPVTDRVVHEILGALLVLRRRGGAAERLSYKGLDVEQIGHVYEGLLEFSCIRVDEPYLGLIGKNEPELPLAELEDACEDIDTFFDWLAATCGASVTAVRKAMGNAPRDEAALHAACDNDEALTDRVRPLHGLLRTDLRGLPTVFPAGSLVITQVGDRRATGTHYTPRAMAEEIVEHTLAPLCYSPGPAEGAEPEDWQVRPADELLSLKVLDPAMGSGAFLVSACRYLADRVVTAWERDGYPDPVLAALGPDFDHDDAVLEAKRRVAARCLCGVDRDEAAVELGKLSLWLVTLAKDRPFSFLDHALRCGDSLVGLISESQIEAFHLDPETGRRINGRLSGAIDEVAGPILTRVRELREEIEAEPVRDAHQADVLATELREAERLIARLLDLADAVAASALSTAGQSAEAFDDRLTSIADEVQQLLTENTPESPLERALRAKLTPWLQGPRPEPIRPLHWALEFPEVMRRGGFDAVVSNPPFMGAPRITENYGDDYHDFLSRLFQPSSKRVDICAYFLRRGTQIAQPKLGMVGMLATNSIREGNTRRGGLDPLLLAGYSIVRARRDFLWPGSASVIASNVVLTDRVWHGQRHLDDGRVKTINSLLDSDESTLAPPFELRSNDRLCFQGGTIWGDGFYLTTADAMSMIRADTRNALVVRPAIGGQELNAGDFEGRRWVIDFREMDEPEARSFTIPFAHLERTIKRWRQGLDPNKYRRIVDSWWKHFHARHELYDGIAQLGLTRVACRSRVSRRHMLAFVPANIFYLDAVAVFLFSSNSDFAVLQSSLHEIWCQKYASRLKADLRYGAKNCFNNYPRPIDSRDLLEAQGARYIEIRRQIMEERNIGLTDAYRLLDDPANTSSDVGKWRNTVIDLDSAVSTGYGWSDIELNHGFLVTDQGVQYTVDLRARAELLNRLLALNHYRYQQEVERGLHSGKGRGASRKKGAGRRAPASGGFDDGSLFPPDGAMF